MAAKMSLSLEEQVTCPICLEQYQDPRILPCLHTYCKHCLEDLLLRGLRLQSSIKCPECREVVKIEDVNSLKVNIWVNKNLTILELLKADVKQSDSKSSIMCDNCESVLSAEARCLDCEKFFCDSCITSHERMSVLTREHQVVTLKEIKEKGIPIRNKPPLCEKHKKEVKTLYCKTCEHLICRDCIIIDHKKHDFCFVDDIVEKHKQEIRTISKETTLIINKIEGCRASINGTQEMLEKNATDTKKQIHELINKQIAALEAQRTILLHQVKNETSIEMKKLTAKEEYFTMHMATLTSAIEFSENLVTKGSSSDVMCLAKQVMTRLKELNAKQLDEKIPELCKPVLQVNDQLHLLNSDIAIITSKTIQPADSSILFWVFVVFFFACTLIPLESSIFFGYLSYFFFACTLIPLDSEG